MAGSFFPGVVLGICIGVAGTYYVQYGHDAWQGELKSDVPDDVNINKDKVREKVQQGKEEVEDRARETWEQTQQQ